MQASQLTEREFSPMPTEEGQGQLSTLPGSRQHPSNSLVFDDVYLLTRHAGDHRAVAGLGVLLDQSGLTVCKPDGLAVATVPWTKVSRLAASGRMQTPVGLSGVVVEATTPSCTHWFLVPCEEPDATERAIVELHRKAPGARTRSRRRGRHILKFSLVIGLLTTLVAGIALSVLVATGTVTF
jgi:hypothetical protein